MTTTWPEAVLHHWLLLAVISINNVGQARIN